MLDEVSMLDFFALSSDTENMRSKSNRYDLRGITFKERLVIGLEGIGWLLVLGIGISHVFQSNFFYSMLPSTGISRGKSARSSVLVELVTTLFISLLVILSKISR